jgi:thioredoxin-related protein
MMQQFVAPTVAKHQDKLALVEKDVERESALARQFRVFGTPTFVLLDPEGREIGRVPADNDPVRWDQRLTATARL